MKLAETEDDPSFFQAIGSSGDKFTRNLLAFVVVLFFFSLILIGIHRAQSASDQAVSNHSRALHKAPTEIGDADGSPMITISGN